MRLRDYARYKLRSHLVSNGSAWVPGTMTVCSHLGYPNRKRVSGTEGSQEIIRQRITSVTKENVFKRGSGGDRPNCGVGTSKRGVFILVLSEYCAPAPYPSTNCVRSLKSQRSTNGFHPAMVPFDC